MQPTSDRLRTIAALLDTFEAEARELGLKARLDVDHDLFAPVFEPQFGASSEWLSRTFHDELAARLDVGSVWRVAAMDGIEVAHAVESVKTALRRTRSRLVDTDSWISGGLTWPFHVADPVLRERGVATYRAPARANAELTIRRDLVTIELPAADCGDVVSAGIWVPTPLAGDFVAGATYALEPWIAGAREACLGLYAVAPDGTFRVYAQRVSRADDPDYVVADVDGRCGTSRATPRRRVGELRIASERGSIFAWHREDSSWTWLARARVPPAKSLIVGIKVWASGFSGPLTARITGLALEGKPDVDPTPPPSARPDPRQASQPAS